MRLGITKNILRLDVSVADTFGMDVCNRSKQLDLGPSASSLDSSSLRGMRCPEYNPSPHSSKLRRVYHHLCGMIDASQHSSDDEASLESRVHDFCSVYLKKPS
jgi:hypothetical protein